MLQSIPAMIAQLPNSSPLWSGVMVFALVVSLALAGLASALRQQVRGANITFAVVYLVALISWPFAVTDPANATSDSYWLYYPLTIATAMATIGFAVAGGGGLPDPRADDLRDHPRDAGGRRRHDRPGGARLGLRDHPGRCDHDHHRDPAQRRVLGRPRPGDRARALRRTPCASTPRRPSACRSTRSCTTACSRRSSRPRVRTRPRRRSSPRDGGQRDRPPARRRVGGAGRRRRRARSSVLASRIADAASALSEPFTVETRPRGRGARCPSRSPRRSTRPPCRRWSTASSTPAPASTGGSIGAVRRRRRRRGGRRPRGGLRSRRSCRTSGSACGCRSSNGCRAWAAWPRVDTAPGEGTLVTLRWPDDAGRARRDRRIDGERCLVKIGVPRAPHRRPRGAVLGVPPACSAVYSLTVPLRERRGRRSSSAMALYALVDGDRAVAEPRDADADLDGVVRARRRGGASAARHGGARPARGRAATATPPGTSPRSARS